uniref:VP6 n=1 Tax=Changuinola virus TaxID=40052 RepID=A0A3S6HA86_9REOV|nr:VP6 [Changuinola virus]
MSIAVLLVPGDLIAKIRTELIERQIQVDLVDWEKNASEITTTKKESNGGGLADSEEKNDKKKETAGEEGQADRETDEIKEKGISTNDNARGGTGERAGAGETRGSSTRTETESDGGGRTVVLTDDISKRLKQKLGVDVEVFPKEGTILYLEKHVQNELSLDKEQSAQQIEIFRKLQREKDKGKHKIERIISMKKLIDLVGKKDVNEKPISAKQSGVKLVTNNIKHVNKATAYFTAPTGDTNWKNVAREASKNANIMAYHSEGESAVKDLMHLIDHL